MSTVDIGQAAESAVADELHSLGYEILEQNWKTTFAEIDIIAVKDKTVHFVEVKFRKNDSAGDGFDYITPTKLKHMKRAAEAWVMLNAWQGPYELLIAAVTKSENSFTIDLRELY